MSQNRGQDWVHASPTKQSDAGSNTVFIDADMYIRDLAVAHGVREVGPCSAVGYQASISVDQSLQACEALSTLLVRRCCVERTHEHIRLVTAVGVRIPQESSSGCK